MPGEILDYVWQGLGETRTAAFDVESIYQYVDTERFKKDYDELVEGMSTEITRMGLVKTKALRDYKVNEEIVDILSTPYDQKLIGMPT